jgi:hypothetical protein
LLVPLLFVSGRRLWRKAEAEPLADDADIDDADDDLQAKSWWRSIGRLLVAMALLGIVLTLAFDARGGSLPAGPGARNAAERAVSSLTPCGHGNLEPESRLLA